MDKNIIYTIYIYYNKLYMLGSQMPKSLIKQKNLQQCFVANVKQQQNWIRVETLLIKDHIGFWQWTSAIVKNTSIKIMNKFHIT